MAEEEAVEIPLKKLAFAGALVFILGCGWWLFSPGAGAAPPVGAHTNVRQQFAACWPDDWKTRIDDECSAARAPCTILYVTKERDDENIPSAIAVDRLPGPPISGRDAEGLAQTLAQSYKEFVPGESGPAVVDGLDSLRAAGSQKIRLRYTVQKEVWTNLSAIRARGGYWAGYVDMSRGGAGAVKVRDGVYEDRDYEFALEGLLVPGRKLNYRITLRGPTSSAAEDEPVFKAFVDSFRVLERPRPIDFDGWSEGSTGAQMKLLALILLALYALARLFS